MSGPASRLAFRLSWLDLREPADRAARDGDLLRRAQAFAAAAENSVAVDLGAGSGATVRAFGGALRWRLVDNDPALLAAAAQRCGPQVATVAADLCDLDALPLEGVRLVTASALFDLASADFIDALADRIAARDAGLYAALSYDGMMRWTPADPDDPAVTAAFNRHQCGDKGFGGLALGPGAGAHLAAAMRGRGYRVWTAASPWRLGPAEAALQRELLAGVAAAAAQAGHAGAAAWHQRRVAVLSGGSSPASSCIVGHIDVLALPEA